MSGIMGWMSTRIFQGLPSSCHLSPYISCSLTTVGPRKSHLCNFPILASVFSTTSPSVSRSYKARCASPSGLYGSLCTLHLTITNSDTTLVMGGRLNLSQRELSSRQMMPRLLSVRKISCHHLIYTTTSSKT